MGINDVEILLVEDNDEDAELAIRALKKGNVSNSILRIKDGEEAIHFLFGTGKYAGRDVKNHKPKVVLLDLKMPKVNGLEVLKKVRKDEILHDLPIVMLTSSNEEKDIIESYNLGVNSYIVKPVDFKRFSKAVVDIGFYWVLLNKIP
ncbi:response regulator [Balneola sp. MJW-20]|uniref:response regulator n=1 Tax=Gracilimonas aurantiaca TaxID=3234185 RepID=UPI003466BB87